MANRPAIQHERIIAAAKRNLPDVLKRMVERRSYIVKQCACRADQVVFAGEPKAVQRKDLEVSCKAVVGRIYRKRPAVVVRRLQHLGRVRPFEPFRELGLRRKLLNAEFSRRKVEKRKPKAGNSADIIVGRLVKKPIFGDGARRDYARDLAANQSLGCLRVLNLVA